MSVSAVLAIGPLSAALLHEYILRQHEIDHLTLPIVAASFVVYIILILSLNFMATTVLYISFWVTLWLYIAIYRMFFHPLRKFRGPFAARVSAWWTVWRNYVTNLHFHRVQQQLQREYGDYVRTGPRELTIFDIDAIPAILGYQSKMNKGPLYDLLEKSLHMNRDKHWHRQRRRVWDSAFKASLSDYVPNIEHFTTQLLQRLQNAQGKPVPLLQTMSFYAYDVMADLAFGNSTNFISGESTEAACRVLDSITSGHYIFGLLHHMPWLLKAMAVSTARFGPLKLWTDWSVSQMKTRMERKDAAPDLVSYLINNTSNDEAGRQLMYGESRLIISAGSETTATALTFIFMHLATHPRYTGMLRNELREHAASFDCQRPLPLLDAIINESMRRWPSVYHASSRITPREGLNINGNFVPENVIVKIPPFTLYHDPRNFSRPDEFIPERWLDQGHLILNKEAFIPFSAGAYSCAGKGLAMMELRSVTARVVSEFDILIPEDFADDDYWDAIQDHFTAGPPELNVRFVKVAN